MPSTIPIINDEPTLQIDGPVFRPGDAEYEAETQSHNAAVQHRPEYAVGVTSSADIAASVQFARKQGFTVAVQCTGHGAVLPITSGILISTRRMRKVVIDPDAQTATLEAGAKMGEIAAPAAEYGLVPVPGSTGDVGATGYLLGGGIGPLSRSHGISSDYVVGFTVITGAGEIVEADAENNAQLFWALRGGKMGLGIVSQLTLRLVPLKTLYGGRLMFEEKHIDQIMRTWLKWTATAHPQVTTSIAVIRPPPSPESNGALPPKVLALRFAYAGERPEELGPQLAEPLRAAAPVMADLLGVMSGADIPKIHDDPVAHSVPTWIGSLLLKEIGQRPSKPPTNSPICDDDDSDFATAIDDFFGAKAAAPFVIAEIRHMGSRAATEHIKHIDGTIPDNASAVGGRGAAFLLDFMSFLPDHFAEVMPAAMDTVVEKLGPWMLAESNINFMGKPRSRENTANIWRPDVAAKLNKIRRMYDPDSVFSSWV
ncbi:MAG: hypothetical protein M1833_003162 [Piccolia ochrophora]|nr:MAG: hypothetical protein M1833_003162 [Piccolia ochrophora]